MWHRYRRLHIIILYQSRKIVTYLIDRSIRTACSLFCIFHFYFSLHISITVYLIHNRPKSISVFNINIKIGYNDRVCVYAIQRQTVHCTKFVSNQNITTSRKLRSNLFKYVWIFIGPFYFSCSFQYNVNRFIVGPRLWQRLWFD